MTSKVFFQGIQDMIAQELRQSRQEILVAMAWFTDSLLFGVLQERLAAGCRVELILSRNEDNKRLPFDELAQAGAQITWMERSAGMMHHKFCLIDQRVLINGSYNWTINASRNNDENASRISDDAEYLQQFRQQFYHLKQRLEQGTSPTISQEETPSTSMTTELSAPAQADGYAQLRDELDMFIKSLVADYDKEQMRQRGYQRSQDLLGSDLAIVQELETMYQQLLTDTSLDHAHKEQIQLRIRNYMREQQRLMEEELLRKTSMSDQQQLAEQKELELSKLQYDQQRQSAETTQRHLRDTQIPIQQRKIAELRDRIAELATSILRPQQSKRMYFILALLVFLGVYLLVFYSSTIYTILYGQADAMAAVEAGRMPSSEIFNTEAIGKAWDKGVMTMFFILSFTFIPFSVGFVSHLSEKKWLRIAALGITALLDGLIAYLVAKNIHEVKMLVDMGGQMQAWQWQHVFVDAVFWMVICLGFVPYFIWGSLLEMLWNDADKRNITVLQQQQQLQQQHLKEQLMEEQQTLDTLQRQIDEQQQEVMRLQGLAFEQEKKMAYVPLEAEKRKHVVRTEFELYQKTLLEKQHLLDAYLAADRVPVSLNSLRERKSVFLEGWNQYLFQQYSDQVANQKMQAAHQRAEQWLESKKQELV